MASRTAEIRGKCALPSPQTLVWAVGGGEREHCRLVPSLKLFHVCALAPLASASGTLTPIPTPFCTRSVTSSASALCMLGVRDVALALVPLPDTGTPNPVRTQALRTLDFMDVMLALIFLMQAPILLALLPFLIKAVYALDSFAAQQYSRHPLYLRIKGPNLHTRLVASKVR